MAERVPSKVKAVQGKDTTLLKKYVTLEVDVIDDADTVTVTNLTTIDSAKVIDLADASDITADIATNVVTINDVSVSADHIVILAVGT